MNLDDLVKKAIEETLSEKGYDNNLNEEDSSSSNSEGLLSEAYATKSYDFKLHTNMLSEKTKTSHKELLEGYVEKLNKIAISIDSVDKESANLNHSAYRSLKIDEVYNHNAVFLHGLYFQNIADVNSQVTTDSLTFMRIERDFGTFDRWQEDFVACCLSARNGWAVLCYNTQLKRYVNTVIDLHSLNVMIGMQPIIVMDCWEHSYYRDYLKDRKTYVFSMMKELNWDVIEKRVEVAEKIAKVLG